MTIAFAYDPPSVNPDTHDSVAAEYEDEATLNWIRTNLKRHGTVRDLPWNRAAAFAILRKEFDVVFNIAEGSAGRNRESMVPAVCEMADVPCTGSDALALGLTLDKEYTKILARHAGVPTPDWTRVSRIADLDAGVHDALRYPIIVKPVSGGSSLGIHDFSKVRNEAELRKAVHWVLDRCGDDALIEEFVPGREFVAGLVCGEPELSLPVAELRFGDGSAESFYSVEWKSNHEKQIICPAQLSIETAGAMATYTARMFALVGATDLCRADFRLSENGTPYFIEINPLPGLSPFYSVFPVQVRAAGAQPETIIDRILTAALERESEHHQASRSRGDIRV